MTVLFHPEEERAQALLLSNGDYWDPFKTSLASSATIGIALGCADWGKCWFCSLPQAASDYIDVYFDGVPPTPEEHVALFRATLEHALCVQPNLKLLLIFMAGSYMASRVTTPYIRDNVLQIVREHQQIERVVIESRAPLLTERNVRAVRIAAGDNLQITTRLGLESRALGELIQAGQGSEAGIAKGIKHAHAHDIDIGAYLLIRPTTDKNLRMVMKQPEATEAEIRAWTNQEAMNSIDWAMELGASEIYINAACVPDNAHVEPLLQAPIYRAWSKGEFAPAPLEQVFDCLRYGACKYPGLVHMERMTDLPPFAAISAIDNPRGLPETLEGATPADIEAHAALERYRMSMDSNDIVMPTFFH